MESQAGGLKNTLVALGPIVIFMVMIFFLFRSQQKANKKKQEMINNIKSGDKIITAGGIYGIVANVKEHSFIVKIADNVKIEVSKSGVTSVMEKDEKESK